MIEKYKQSIQEREEINYGRNLIKKPCSISSTITDSFTSTKSESPVDSVGELNAYCSDYLEDTFSSAFKIKKNHSPMSYKLASKDEVSHTNTQIRRNPNLDESLAVKRDARSSLITSSSISQIPRYPLFVYLPNEDALGCETNSVINLDNKLLVESDKQTISSKTLSIKAKEFIPNEIYRNWFNKSDFSIYDKVLSQTKSNEYKCFCIANENSILFQHNINGMAYFKNFSVCSTTTENTTWKLKGNS